MEERLKPSVGEETTRSLLGPRVEVGQTPALYGLRPSLSQTISISLSSRVVLLLQHERKHRQLGSLERVDTDSSTAPAAPS